MREPMTPEIAAILAAIPAFSGLDPEKCALERLGGLTNRNYRLSTPKGEFVLRIPGAGTGEYINRGDEEVAARIAAEVGVNAPIIHFDSKTGIQVARFIDGARTMNSERFKDKGAIARAAISLRKIHGSGRSFRNRFELFRMIDDYLDLLAKKKARLPDGYEAVKREADSVRRALAAANPPLAPCHCDPLAENFLDTGKTIYVIDWEYAGNNDPMWDLGDLSVEAEFDSEQDRALLEAYFEGRVPPAEAARMILYKAMCDLLWTLWGIIQHENGNQADDFWAYAENRFRRCRALMASESFAQALASLARG